MDGRVLKRATFLVVFQVFKIQEHRLTQFLKTFTGMKDLVLNVTADGISASGTVERSFFLKKWISFKEDEGLILEAGTGGSIPVGQLDLFKSLVVGCGSGLILVESDDNITLTGSDSSFTIPPVAEAHSQAGVEQMEGLMSDQPEDPMKWTNFGTSELSFNLSFDAEEVRSLREVGKAIQAGALYTVEVDADRIEIIAERDQIRVNKGVDLGEWIVTPEEKTTLVFGKWLMDALKAMPGLGTIYFVGGADAPLLIHHKAPDNDNGWGTFCIVAPRQENAGVSA
tara:strand:+ start:6663 stop:7511 length:849 start_codon:yes stop_codon:yes gene_type:complete